MEYKALRFVERLNNLRKAWENCPEIEYEIDNMKKVRLDRYKFTELFVGEEVDIERNTSKVLAKQYPYEAYIYLYGIKVFCYLTEDDLDEEAKAAIDGH